MVKRAKLTLEHGGAKAHVKEAKETKEADFPESVVTEQAVVPARQYSLSKILLVAGLTIASLIIFKQKIL